jgi:hypothetical protein
LTFSGLPSLVAFSDISLSCCYSLKFELMLFFDVLCI